MQDRGPAHICGAGGPYAQLGQVAPTRLQAAVHPEGPQLAQL